MDGVSIALQSVQVKQPVVFIIDFGAADTANIAEKIGITNASWLINGTAAFVKFVTTNQKWNSVKTQCIT